MSLTLGFVGGLFALAFVDLWLRRRGEEHESAEGVASDGTVSLRFLLRPLLPSYRFFARIETRLELRVREVIEGADPAPWVPEPAPRVRPWYFWVYNPHENLWLAEQAILHELVDNGNRFSTIRLLDARVRRSQAPGSRFQFAVFSADERADPLFVSPVLEAVV